MKQRVPFLVGLALAGLFAWLALRHVDLAASARFFLAANKAYAVPIILCLAGFYWLKALRWARLFDDSEKIGVRQLLPSMMIGFAGNNLLPMRLGELIRVYLASHDLGRSKTLVLATMVVERLFDLVTIVLILVVASLLIDADVPALDAARTFLVTLGIVLVLATVAIAFPPEWLVRMASTLARRLPEGLANAVTLRVRQMQRGFSALRNISGFPPIVVNSLVQWLLLAFCIYAAIAAFDVTVSPLAAVTVMGLLVAGISLPGAPGFIGTIEFCFVLGLGFFGVGADKALGIAVFYHLLTFAFVVLTGTIYMKRYNYSLSNLKSNAEAIRREGD